MVKDRDSNYPSSGFENHKCYAGCKAGNFARYKICPARVYNAVKDTGQLDVGVRLRAKRVIKRVVECETRERVETSKGVPVMPNVIKIRE